MYNDHILPQTFGHYIHGWSSLLTCNMQTEKCGSGIVADEDIKRGDFVIEYVGEGELFHFLIIF